MNLKWSAWSLLFLLGCSPSGPPVIDVDGADYAFVGVPDTLSAGPTAFGFRNIGKVRHEMGITRLRPGRTMRDLVEGTLPDDSLYARSGGVLLTKAGELADGRLLVDLLPGTSYLVWCDFKDSTGAPRHSDLGMAKVFTVR